MVYAQARVHAHKEFGRCEDLREDLRREVLWTVQFAPEDMICQSQLPKRGKFVSAMSNHAMAAGSARGSGYKA